MFVECVKFDVKYELLSCVYDFFHLNNSNPIKLCKKLNWLRIPHISLALEWFLCFLSDF